MREILFRGKRADNDEWAEGFYGQPQGEGSSYADIYVWEKSEISDSIELVRRVVYANTVGQFTGLTDKNGKKIFEGDILKIITTVNGEWVQDENGNYKELKRIDCAVVQEDKNTGGYKLKVYHNRKYKRISRFNSTHIYCYYKAEVIGNIHDNPELLEDGE